MAENKSPLLDWKFLFLITAAILFLGLIAVGIMYDFFLKSFVVGKTDDHNPYILGSSEEASPSPLSWPSEPPSDLSSNQTSQPRNEMSTEKMGSEVAVESSPKTIKTDEWVMLGDVLLIDQKSKADAFIQPTFERSVIRIGKPENQGRPLSENRLEVPISSQAKSLSFRYNFFSYDYQGFDNPGFKVSLNNQILFSAPASEIDTDTPATTRENLDSTGWKEVTIPLSVLNKLSQKLIFQAGNDEINVSTETQHQSWVYLDSIKIE